VAATLGHVLDRQMHRALARHGVTSGQFTALAYIAEHPEISRSDLARGLQVTPQAAGAVARQLVDNGLLAPTTCRRGYPLVLSLTPTGAQMLLQAAPAVEAMTREMLGLLSPEIASVAEETLRHILTRLTHDDPRASI
jgi:DNA-binding MarR family transcriptional regulator